MNVFGWIRGLHAGRLRLRLGWVCLLMCIALVAHAPITTSITRAHTRAQSGSAPIQIGSDAITPSSQMDATDQIIVRFRDTTTTISTSQGTRTPPNIQIARVQSASAFSGEPLHLVRVMDDGAVVLKLGGRKPITEVRDLAQRVATMADVHSAEPDVMAYPALVPNDAYFVQQWHLAAPSTTVFGVNLVDAWDISSGSPSIVMALIDSGVLNHADLAGRLAPGYDFVSDVQIANDGDTRDANPSDPGDWVTTAESATGFFKGCTVRNSSWHGTHVAGIMGAAANNGLGVTGVNWVSKILPVRALGKCGGYSSDIADGIRWAAGLNVNGVPANPNPARVINMSLGGSGACLQTYQNAIDAVTAVGTVVVVAAGNGSVNASTMQPANCNNVITVAAINKAGNLASYSNYGSIVDVVAPGGDGSLTDGLIISTLNTGTTTPQSDSYAYYRGTSMAAPIVSGIASLMLSMEPTLQYAQVLALLQGSVTGFPAGSTCTVATCGPGVSNAEAAVVAADNAVTTSTSTATPTPTVTQSPATTGTATPPATATPTSTATATATVTVTSNRRTFVPVVVR